MSWYYQYVYLEITVSCSEHGSNYFLLVQNHHTPKGCDVQWMVHRNQHNAVALHLAVSMNAWPLYDLDGVEPKQLLSNVSNNCLMFTNSWFYLKKFISNAVIPWKLPLIQDIFIDRWLKIWKWNFKEVGSNESIVFACLSTISFPWIPIWLGIQQRTISLLAKSSWHFSNSFWICGFFELVWFIAFNTES